MRDIELVNMKYEKPTQPYDVRIDRQSKWGNPFKNENRDTVCDKYEKYFNNVLVKQAGFQKSINELFKIFAEHKCLRLFCWCAPERCHGETIIKYLRCNNDNLMFNYLENKIKSILSDEIVNQPNTIKTKQLAKQIVEQFLTRLYRERRLPLGMSPKVKIIGDGSKLKVIFYKIDDTLYE